MRSPEMLDRSTTATGTPKMLPELEMGGTLRRRMIPPPRASDHVIR